MRLHTNTVWAGHFVCGRSARWHHGLKGQRSAS